MRTERIEAADIAQIYKLWKAYADAIHAGNMEKWIALWCKDGIQMLPGYPQLVGNDQILSHSLSPLNQFSSEFSINPDVVRVLGDHAYSYGTFSSFLTSARGAAKQICGKFLAVLKKQGDGSWKILVNCFNFDGELKFVS